MANYPDRHSAALPALAAAQRVHGWCSPEAIEQVACVMRVTPAYLESVATLLRHARDRARCAATACTCARTSPARCAAPTSCSRRCCASRPPATAPDVNVRAFECLGACDIAPMASVDGVYVGPLGARGRAAAARRTSAPGDRCCPSSSSRAGSWPTRARTARGFREHAVRAAAGESCRDGMAAAAAAPMLLLDRHRRAGAATLEVYERRGGYQALRKALAMDARRGARRSSKPRACAAAAARASRWARRSPSCRRARWTSTWCATPTSPSRAPSRTAN